MSFKGVKVNVPLLIVFVLIVLAVCSILVGAAWKSIHPFAGGVLAGWLSIVLVLVTIVLWKHRDK